MTPRDRRALVLGAVTVLGAVVLVRGLPATLRFWHTLRQRTARQVETARRSRAILAAQPAIRDSLTVVLGKIVALAPQLVEGRSSAEAGASLSGLLSLAASRHELRMVRLDPLADSSAGVLRRIQAHAELEGDVRGLARLLKAVETSDPVLDVVSLEISPADPFSSATTAEVLHIELTVSAYYLPSGAQ